MKKTELAKKAIETLKRTDGSSKPIVIDNDKYYLNIAIVNKQTNSILRVLSFNLNSGVVRIYSCEAAFIRKVTFETYYELAWTLHEMFDEVDCK